MTALIVIGIIFIFFAVLFSFSLTVYVSITDEVTIKIGAFGYKVTLDFYDEPVKKSKKEKTNKKKSKKIATKKKNTPKNVEEVNENTLVETIEFSLRILSSIGYPVKDILKHIRIVDFHLFIAVCSENASDTAINYGRISGGVYALLGHLDSLIKVRIKDVSIKADFVGDTTVYQSRFKVKLRISCIIKNAISILFKIITNTIKHKHEHKQTDK